MIMKIPGFAGNFGSYENKILVLNKVSIITALTANNCRLMGLLSLWDRFS